MSRRPRVRAEAARVIADVVGRGRNLDRALTLALEAIEDRRDKAFLQAICYGVVRFYPRLDRILAELLERPLRPRDIQLRALILAGLYQISSMDVPPLPRASMRRWRSDGLGQRASSTRFCAVMQGSGAKSTRGSWRRPRVAGRIRNGWSSV